MYPDLFGINDFSYTLMIIIGVCSAFAILILFLKKNSIKRNGLLDASIVALFTIAIGLTGAILTQNLYRLISSPSTYKWGWDMTFYGGLLFGVPSFIIIFYLLTRKSHSVPFKYILIIAPACVTMAHAFGRIGCFLAGCCYGKEVSMNFGLQCSYKDSLYHIPTQLYEAVFLFLLSSLLLALAFKKQYKYTSIIYLNSYATFRFIIEFFRGDDRGGFIPFLSPSQFWCIVLALAAVPLYFVLRHIVFKEDSLSTYEKE